MLITKEEKNEGALHLSDRETDKETPIVSVVGIDIDRLSLNFEVRLDRCNTFCTLEGIGFQRLG